MGFVLKKLISAVLMPLPGCMTLAALGVVLVARGRRRLGWGAVGAATLLLWAAGTTPVADALMRAVETDAPAFPGDSVDFVLVLGGGHVSDPALPLSAQLYSPALHRLAEGVAIATAQPWSRLLLSGWGGADPRSNADVYREVGATWGFPELRMVLDPRPRDTRQEAELWAAYVGDRPFALVTSAFHMDRALALFRARGLDPIPAPTGHLTAQRPALDVLDFLPSESNLVRTRLAWHEVLGRLWAGMVGAT